VTSTQGESLSPVVSDGNGYPKEFRFKVSQDNVRSFKDPNNPDLQIHHVYIRIRDFAHGQIPDDVNPRSHENPTGRIPKAIRETLKDTPRKFHLRNRGLLILAQKCWYDNKTQTLHIVIASPEQGGVADGATTDRVLREMKEEVAKDLSTIPEEDIPEFLRDAYAHLEIISGDFGDDLVDLTRARNTSVQVQEFALENLGGGFDWLHEVIDQSEFQKRIRYRENDPEAVDIRAILGLLTLFHPKWNEEGKEPQIAFTSKGQVLQNFRDDKWKPGYQALRPVVLDILRLSEHIHLQFQPQYAKYKEENSKAAKLGMRKEIAYRESGFMLPLSGEQTKYLVPDGWLYPIIASFRMLLQFPNDGPATWVMDPQQFFDNHGYDLVGLVAETSENLGRNPAAAGKSRPLWVQLRTVMELHRMKINAQTTTAGD
jgi:hypothetical protein